MLRRAGLVLAVMCWMAALPAMTPSVAVAQEKAAAEEGVKRPERSRFIWVVESSGFIGFVIVCLSGYFVATVIKLFMKMKTEVAAPPAVIARCEELLAARDFKGIYEMVQEDDSFFSRVVTTGITELPNGLAEAREAMERVGEAITAEMEKKISMLAVLGTLGPMIGLLGTLKGMIASFGVIAAVRTAVEGRPGGRRHFRGPAADVRRRGPVGAGDLLLRLVPQPRDLHRHLGDAARRPVPAAFLPGHAGRRQESGRRGAAGGTRQDRVSPLGFGCGRSEISRGSYA